MQEEDEDGGIVRTPPVEQSAKRGRDRMGTAAQAKYSLSIPSTTGPCVSKGELSRD